MYMFAQRVSFSEDITVTKEIISSISLFRSLRPEQIQTMLSVMQVRYCRQGARIFSAGDKPREIYVVLSGRVDFVTERAGVHQIQKAYEVGATFGEPHFTDANCQIGTAIASTIDVELLILSDDVMSDLQRRKPKLSATLMQNLNVGV